MSSRTPRSAAPIDVDATRAFAGLARGYCAWAENAPQEGEAEEVVTALDLLLRLTRDALHLPEGEGSEEEAEWTTQDEWLRIYRRFASLPVDVYYKTFDPLVDPSDQVVSLHIADDLADIHRDLHRGLILYDRGDLDGAAWQWAIHFRGHWGKHAVGAIYALQAWWADHTFQRDAEGEQECAD